MWAEVLIFKGDKAKKVIYFFPNIFKNMKKLRTSSKKLLFFPKK